MKESYKGNGLKWGFSEEGLERFRRLSLRERIRFVEEIILLKHDLGLLERERNKRRNKKSRSRIF